MTSPTSSCGRRATTLVAAQDLAANPNIADEIIGFLAQQCVEKSLKAVLEVSGVRFEKTHDIDQLLDMLAAARDDIPDGLDAASTLNPFAVALRYAEIEASEPLNRPETCGLIERVLTWASGVVEQSD